MLTWVVSLSNCTRWRSDSRSYARPTVHQSKNRTHFDDWFRWKPAYAHTRDVFQLTQSFIGSIRNNDKAELSPDELQKGLTGLQKGVREGQTGLNFLGSHRLFVERVVDGWKLGLNNSGHVKDDDCRSGSLPEILQYRVWPVSRTETFNTQVHWLHLSKAI